MRIKPLSLPISSLKQLLLPAAIAAMTVPWISQAGTYEQTFTGYWEGATEFNDGSVLIANSGLGTTVGIADAQRSELQLTAYGTNSTRSAFILPDLDPGVAIDAFSAKWNSQIWGAGGTNGKADGFALTFGNVPFDLSSLVSDAINGERGPGTGLTFSVSTYDAGQPDTVPGYRIFSDGLELAYVNKPGDAWGHGDTTRNSFEVDWSKDAGLSVSVNGVPVFTNVPTPDFTPTAGMQLFFTARTGGATQEVRLDNIAILTAGLLSQIGVTAPFSSGNSPDTEGAAQAFDGDTSTKWLTFSSAGFLGAQTDDGLPRKVTAYSLVTGNDSPDRHPSSWTLEGSLDGETWSIVDTVDGFPSPISLNNQQSFIVDNPGDFSFYRVNIYGTNGASLTQLDDVKFYETLSTVPEPSSTMLLGSGVALFAARRRRKSIL